MTHLVDTNLLVYSTFDAVPEHEAARAWLESRLGNTRESVSLCWPVVYSYVRLVTSTRVFGANAVSVARGWEAATAFLSQPAVRVITAGPGHAMIAAELASTPGLRSEDIPDIEIAALAIEHGLVLATHDHGFGRFRKLRWIDPLTAA